MTRKMFYDLVFAAILAGVAYATIASLSGCAGTDYKGVGVYKQDPPLKTRADIRREQAEVKPEPKPEPRQTDTAQLEAKIDALQATVNQFMQYQTYHTEVQAKDRAADLKRDQCFAKCEKEFPWPKHGGQRTEREQADADDCWKPCQDMPKSPGGGGC